MSPRFNDDIAKSVAGYKWADWITTVLYSIQIPNLSYTLNTGEVGDKNDLTCYSIQHLFFIKDGKIIFGKLVLTQYKHDNANTQFRNVQSMYFISMLSILFLCSRVLQKCWFFELFWSNDPEMFDQELRVKIQSSQFRDWQISQRTIFVIFPLPQKSVRTCLQFAEKDPLPLLITLPPLVFPIDVTQSKSN